MGRVKHACTHSLDPNVTHWDRCGHSSQLTEGEIGSYWSHVLSGSKSFPWERNGESSELEKGEWEGLNMSVHTHLTPMWHCGTSTGPPPRLKSEEFRVISGTYIFTGSNTFLWEKSYYNSEPEKEECEGLNMHVHTHLTQMWHTGTDVAIPPSLKRERLGVIDRTYFLDQWHFCGILGVH